MRENHAAVDTDGDILACVIDPANAHDSRWLPDLLDAVRSVAVPRRATRLRRCCLLGVRAVYADAWVHRGDPKGQRLRRHYQAEGEGVSQTLRPLTQALSRRADLRAHEVLESDNLGLGPDHRACRELGATELNLPLLEASGKTQIGS